MNPEFRIHLCLHLPIRLLLTDKVRLDRLSSSEFHLKRAIPATQNYLM
jgi:hypothetical protein